MTSRKLTQTIEAVKREYELGLISAEDDATKIIDSLEALDYELESLKDIDDIVYGDLDE